MVNDIRKLLLSDIISSKGVFYGKYSGGFNALKGVIELEQEDTADRLPKSIFESFKKIEKDYNNIDKELKGVPLDVLEQYVLRNSKDLNTYVYISFGDFDYSDFTCMQLYRMIENYFQRIFLLAVKIADYCALEIKMKDSNDKNSENDFGKDSI